ncbi:hypothetical protein [Nostoc sp.]|uniref:hypothetical protein n=1 Tax=Nostoc sp. TaxID=1180 RepID=UPI002FF8DF4E
MTGARTLKGDQITFYTFSELPSTIREANFFPERLLTVRKRYSAVYQGLSALLRLSGAIDFITGEEINDVLYFEEQIDSHHIFLVAWCRKQGIDPKKYNCLVNRTPLSAKTNKKIGSKPSSAYLQELEMSGVSPQRLDEILRSHAIDSETLRRDDFEGFFQTRAVCSLCVQEGLLGSQVREKECFNNHPG